MPQYSEEVEAIIAKSSASFSEPISIEERSEIPPNGEYSLTTWLKIPDVICIFVDIRNSTQLSATRHEKGTASVYELFTGTAVKIFNQFEPSYIDVKGDGVFALFNSNDVFRALAAAITFKTFAFQTFIPLVRAKSENLNNIGFHMGIDQKTVLVKKVGMRDSKQTERSNEVWAGKPINMAAKLASSSKDNELWISDRFFEKIKMSELATKSCGCVNSVPSETKEPLWFETDVAADKNFDFDKAFILKSIWCENHGKEWCQKMCS